jgi:hypothetical protein
LLCLQKERVLVDKATGDEVVLKPKHSLLCVPVQLWPVVFVAFGLISVVVDGLKTTAQPTAAANVNRAIVSE